MALITRTDGTVIAWGGEVNGPIKVLSPMGQPTGFVTFNTTIAVDGELREVFVNVHERAMYVLGRQDNPNRDQRSRDLIVRFIQQRCESGSYKLTENKEHFTLHEKELRELLDAVTRAPVKLKCTVQIPMTGGNEPELHEIDVFDELNAIPMLRNHLPQKPEYRWEAARVVRTEPLD